MEAVGLATTGEESIAMAAMLQPDMTLMDHGEWRCLSSPGAGQLA
jgi:hypothetical protein